MPEKKTRDAHRIDGFSIPKSQLSEQLALSLVDKYVAETGVSCADLAMLFHVYTPEEDEIYYSERQVRHWMKRNRSVSERHFVGLVGFICSEKFISVIPEAKYLFQDQKTAKEAGLLLSRLYGYRVDEDVGIGLDKFEGYWCSTLGSWLWIKCCRPYNFAVTHFFISDQILSGYFYLNGKTTKRRGREYIEMDSILTSRLSHVSFLKSELPRDGDPDPEGLNYRKKYLQVVPPSMWGPMYCKWLISKESPHKKLLFKASQYSYSKYDSFSCYDRQNVDRYFTNFIDKNMWRVVPDDSF